MEPSLDIQVYQSFLEIDEEQWRRIEPQDFPFQDYTFLRSLETGGCLGVRTGWLPRIYTAWDQGQLVAAIAVYEKTNSYGEYIFDWEWAHAYHQNGMAYYPKWVLAAPFTPATGPKLLGVDENAKQVLLNRLLHDFDAEGASSIHALFLPKAEVDTWKRRGFRERHSLQFHWKNKGYCSFDEFLGALKGKRRRQIERERRQIPGDVEIRTLTGGDLCREDADKFYRFYESTIEKKGAIPYLTQAFFRKVFGVMSDQIVLVTALREGRDIAAAINFVKGRTLFGRYWGCLEEARNLHFELCYYRAIEFAIENGIQTFEAGAQGPHKLQRGFDAELIYSAHKIKHPAFEAAISKFLIEEQEQISLARADALLHSANRVR